MNELLLGHFFNSEISYKLYSWSQHKHTHIRLGHPLQLPLHTSLFFPLHDPRNFPEVLEAGRVSLESLASLGSNK